MMIFYIFWIWIKLPEVAFMLQLKVEGSLELEPGAVQYFWTPDTYLKQDIIHIKLLQPLVGTPAIIAVLIVVIRTITIGFVKSSWQAREEGRQRGFASAGGLSDASQQQRDLSLHGHHGEEGLERSFVDCS